jgi:hypothetical protein
VELMARRKLTSKAARRGRTNRSKGHSFEREVATQIRAYAITGAEEAKRGIGQARDSGEVSDVVGLPGWWVECKHKRGSNVVAAMEQAIRDKNKTKGGASKNPLVVFRPHNKRDFPDLAVLRIGDFLEMIEELCFLREQAKEEGIENGDTAERDAGGA